MCVSRTGSRVETHIYSGPGLHVLLGFVISVSFPVTQVLFVRPLTGSRVVWLVYFGLYVGFQSTGDNGYAKRRNLF